MEHMNILDLDNDILNIFNDYFKQDNKKIETEEVFEKVDEEIYCLENKFTEEIGELIYNR